jgi:superfamily II DNA or RNA helicase
MTSNHKTLTRQGYILSKSQLSSKQITTIKKELTVKPVTHPDYDKDSEPFEVFTENASSFCVPRYYGTKKFGTPEKELNLGTNAVDLQFTGRLRESQLPIIDECLRRIRQDGGGLISLHCGAGKCLAKGTKVLMYDGTTKNVEDIQIGDKLMGDDSNPRQVLTLAQGKEEMYDIIPTEGKKYTVNKSHILSLKYDSDDQSTDINKTLNKGDILDIEVQDYLKLPERYHAFDSPLKGFRVKVQFSPKHINIDPYTLGAWLAKNPNIAANKNIPHMYKCNTDDIRLNILAGIVDSAGILTLNGYDIIHKNEQLIDDIIYLSRSLGFNAYKSTCWKEFIDSDGSLKKNIYHKTTISGAINSIPTKNQNKANISNESQKDVTTYGIKVVSIGIGNYYGFEIDGNRRFLLGDFTVTHNTVLSLYLACQLKLRTLVIVHKSFLQNQWYERIKQFTNASIGMIRQKKVDVKNRDIVVGMLQSIAMIDYPPEVFEQFDCIIIDECHHCPSRVFLRALRKVGGKYTIGLSATPKRADGLMKVCHWHVGEIIYKLERKGENGVSVKMFNYESPDKKLFVKKERWINGKVRPFIPTMTTNLCKIKGRNSFIVDIINTIRKQEDRKILILSGRIAHLEDMKGRLDKIVDDEIKSGDLEPDEFKTAFYIGRMKEYELEAAATADVIFATYAMAEEGLDIDSLNVLILATPKRDIVQSVGRILRKPIAEGDKGPIIVDINDCLSVFENWGSKRKQYYEEKKYTVDCYQAYDDKCLSTFDYLKTVGVIKSTDKKVDIVKEFIIHKFGEMEYDMIVDSGIEDEETKKEFNKYYYNPDLQTIFPCHLDTFEE